MGSVLFTAKPTHRPRLFCLVKSELVLLHGFIKKTQKTPPDDLALARKRQKEIER